MNAPTPLLSPSNPMIDPFGRTSVRSNGVRVVVRDVIPPAPPSQVTTAVARDTIVVSWVPSPDASVASYRLWRSTRHGTK